MRRPGFSDRDGEQPLIEALSRGWGVQSRCVELACNAEGRMTSLDLLERFHPYLDRPVRDLLQKAVCRACKGPVLLYTINTFVPLPRPEGERTWTAEVSREAMSARIREYAASKAAAGRADYRAAKAR